MKTEDVSEKEKKKKEEKKKEEEKKKKSLNKHKLSALQTPQNSHSRASQLTLAIRLFTPTPLYYLLISNYY